MKRTEVRDGANMKTKETCWLSFLGFALSVGVAGTTAFAQIQTSSDFSALQQVAAFVPAPDAHGTFPYLVARKDGAAKWRFAVFADPLMTARQNPKPRSTWLRSYLAASGVRPHFDMRSAKRQDVRFKIVVSGSPGTLCATSWTPFLFDAFRGGLVPTGLSNLGCAPASGASDELAKAFLALDGPTRRLALKSMTRTERLELQATAQQVELDRSNVKVVIATQERLSTDPQSLRSHLDLR